MSNHTEPAHKSIAQKDAETLLLRNAPDEDQMLREYLTKHMRVTGSGPVQLPVKSSVQVAAAAYEAVAAVDNSAVVCDGRQGTTARYMEHERYHRADYADDYSSRQNFCG